MQFEVFTIGGGRFLYNFLGATAAITQSAQFGYAMNTALLVGLAWASLMIAFKPTQWDATRTWMGVTFLVVFAAIQMKATVKITDRIDPAGSSGYIVANVPAGIAAFAGITSQFGDEMTRLMEANMVDVDAPKLHQHGFMFGVRLLGNATRMEIRDPVFSANLSAYIRNCLFYDILLGRKTIDGLRSAGDPWAYMTGDPSRARMFVVQSRDASTGAVTSTIKTCAAGIGDLNRQWSTEIPAATRRLAIMSRPDDLRPDTRTPGTGGAWNEARVRVITGHVTNDLGVFHRYLIGASRASADILKRQMTINAIVNEPLDWNAELGNSAAVQNYIDARLALQTRQSYKGIWRQAEEWVPNLKAVFQGLYYGMAPVMLLLILTPMGVGILRNYMFGFLWIESWGPLYAIINYFVNSRAQNEMMALVKTAGGGGGDIQLVAQAGIRAVEADISVMAGQLAMMVMFISIAMVAGVGRYAYLASAALAVPQEAIASTTAESATGNMSVGNTSHDTHSFHNESAFAHNISPSWDSGHSLARTDRGGMAWQAPGGAQGLHHTGGHSALASGINYGAQINEAHSEAIETAQTNAATARTGLETAASATTGSFDSFGKTLLDENALASSFGTSQRDSINTNVNTVLAYMNEHGIGKELSDEQKLAAALSAGVGTPKGMPIVSADGKVSYDVGASDRLTHGEREQITQNTKVSEALDNILSAELSKSSSHRFGETHSFGEGVEARLSQMRNFSETEAREFSETQRLQDSLSQVKSRGGGVNTDYQQAFVTWFNDTGQGPAEWLEPETTQDHHRLAELQQRFMQEEVLPKEFGIRIKPDLKGEHEKEAAELKDRANIPGTHEANRADVPDGDYVGGEMDKGREQLRQDGDTVRGIVKSGQQETEEQVQQNQQAVKGAVKNKQDQTKVGRVIESLDEDVDDAVELAKQAWSRMTSGEDDYPQDPGLRPSDYMTMPPTVDAPNPGNPTTSPAHQDKPATKDKLPDPASGLMPRDRMAGTGLPTGSDELPAGRTAGNDGDRSLSNVGPAETGKRPAESDEQAIAVPDHQPADHAPGDNRNQPSSEAGHPDITNRPSESDEQTIAAPDHQPADHVPGDLEGRPLLEAETQATDKQAQEIEGEPDQGTPSSTGDKSLPQRGPKNEGWE